MRVGERVLWNFEGRPEDGGDYEPTESWATIYGDGPFTVVSLEGPYLTLEYVKYGMRMWTAGLCAWRVRPMTECE